MSRHDPFRQLAEPPWEGSLRPGWHAKRFRFLLELNPSKLETRSLSQDTEVSFVPMEAVGENGGLELSAIKPLADVSEGYTYFRNGDVVVAKITPCFENGKGAIAAGLSNGIAFGTTELHVLRPGADIDAGFLFYVTLGQAFRKLGAATMYGAGGQKRVPEVFIRDLVHPIPALDQQRTIATFLDRKTAEIDALIAKKQLLIELLEEKCTALITKAVTKGLAPGVAMKESGVEWLGAIPPHWGVAWLGLETKCLDGTRVPLNSEERSYMQGDIPYWGANSIVDHVDQWLFDEELVLLGEDGAPFFDRGRPVAFHVVGKVWVNNHAHVLRPSSRLNPSFLAHALNTVDYRLYIMGSTRDKLNQDDMRAISIQVPPIAEQDQIVEYIRSSTNAIDALVENVRSALNRLKEYRSALITAAVTGQMPIPPVPAEAA